MKDSRAARFALILSHAIPRSLQFDVNVTSYCGTRNPEKAEPEKK
jgi:hypothetical protein